MLVSEGAMFEGGEMVFEARDDRRVRTQEAGRHRGPGFGEAEGAFAQVQQRQAIDVINQKLGYLVRCGDPDAIDSIVPMAYGNLALDLLLSKIHGRLVVLRMAATTTCRSTP